MNQNLVKRPAVLAILVVFGFGVLSLPYFISVLGRRGKTPVTIVVAPPDTNIQIDGKEIGNGTQYITPGTYEFTFDREDFFTYTETFEISESDDPDDNIIAVPLEPANQLGQAIVDQYADTYLQVEEFAGLAAQIAGQKFRDENPIVNNLPYNDPNMSIDFGVDDEGGLQLIARARGYSLGGTKQAAAIEAIEAKVAEFGYDPANFVIEYRGSYEFDIARRSEDFSVSFVEDRLPRGVESGKKHGQEGYLKIDIHPTPDNLFTFDPIDPTPAEQATARSEAFAYIRSLGYEPNDFRLEYTPSEVNQRYGNNSSTVEEEETVN